MSTNSSPQINLYFESEDSESGWYRTYVINEVKADKIVSLTYGIFGSLVSVIAIVYYSYQKKTPTFKIVYFIITLLFSLVLTGFSAYLLFSDTHENRYILQIVHPTSLLLGIVVTIPININFTIFVVIVNLVTLIIREKLIKFSSLI